MMQIQKVKKTTHERSDKMKQAYGYARTATIKQADEANSIEAQISRIEKYCKNKKIKLVDIFSDSGLPSQKILNKSALNEMLLKCIENKIEIVIVTDCDRISRNPTDYFLIRDILRKNGVELTIINKPSLNSQAEQNFIDEILISVNALNSRLKNRRKNQ
ncbi:MAG: hypothetical protein UV17_C0020G0016 [Candidatus Gottesmanbacteria bacterium GW2011_GWA1_42_26]|nr:MAG: hypothetical protein UV17_C0020G0016 [Candidatus Gottesmanbacteria bacterium GW2011_GWA1_42_26]